MKHLEYWSSSNGLALNTSKTTGLVRYWGKFRAKCDIESALPGVNFHKCVRLLGIIFNESLGWRNHVDLIEKKCSQRLYILRRIRSFVTRKEFMDIYNGIIRSLLEYACPVFLGIGSVDSKRLQRIQDRCLKLIASPRMFSEDLDSRRKRLSLRLFAHIPSQKTSISALLPPLLPSGRNSVPFCNTSLRRNSFFPMASILLSSCHCD